MNIATNLDFIVGAVARISRPAFVAPNGGSLNSYLSRDLTHMHHSGILMHMRTTLNIDDSLLRDAAKLTGVKEKTSLVRLGLEALIAKESARRLANLGGTEKRLRRIRRRRPRRFA
jgi:Arc/MetJ family transcription regulator